MQEYKTPLPLIHESKLNREFPIGNFNIDVTSVDISSHGCFLIVGCSNGLILLYDLSNPASQTGGFVIGQIKAKGLHTNLLLTLKITDDCRFCFAGVLKGSSEMMAIDLRNFPTNLPSISHSIDAFDLKASVFPDMNLTSSPDTFYHSDAKLRGFSAVAGYAPGGPGSGNDTQLIYRLACGKGIKNVHVWQFEYEKSPMDSPSAEIHTSWTCIYDVATNGSTITNICFSDMGRKLYSKSSSCNIRMWDLTRFEEDPEGRPAHEDIANSQDIKCLTTDGQFFYGGTYEFSIVKKTGSLESKEANRDLLELPEKILDEESQPYLPGLRRRRTNREIEDILCTGDGEQVLVLCSDGGVMYFQNPGTVQDLPTPSPEGLALSSESESPSLPKAAAFSPLHHTLVEVPNLRRNTETEQFWSLKRVGSNGKVVLISATCTPSDLSPSSGGIRGAFVKVSFLEDVLLNAEIQLEAPTTKRVTSSNDFFYSFNLYDSSHLKLKSMAAPPASATPPPKPVVPMARPAAKKKRKEKPLVSKPAAQKKVPTSQSTHEEAFDRLTSYCEPANQSPMARHISPTATSHIAPATVAPNPNSDNALPTIHKRARFEFEEKENISVNLYEKYFIEHKSKPVIASPINKSFAPLTVSAPPRVRKVLPSSQLNSTVPATFTVQKVAKPPKELRIVPDSVQDALEKFVAKSSSTEASTYAESVLSGGSRMGVCTLKALGAILIRQTRLKIRLIETIRRWLEVADSFQDLEAAKKVWLQDLQELQSQAQDLVVQQRLEFSTAWAMDSIGKGTTDCSRAIRPHIQFFFDPLFLEAQRLLMY